MKSERNDGYEVSLERRKIHAAPPDPDDARHGQVRVIDESGEDYLFPAEYFAPIELPQALRRAVLAAHAHLVPHLIPLDDRQVPRVFVVTAAAAHQVANG